jgi:repressor LexA
MVLPDVQLTEQQRRFFELLLDFRRREGVMPSMRELQQLGGFRSPRSVGQYLEALERAGYIQRLPGARNLRLLRQSSDLLPDRSETTNVPVVGRVAAGLPLLAEENITELRPVSRKLLHGSGQHFLLEVVGDSMNAAGIDDGDLVLVRQQVVAEPGMKVVALIDEEATVKVFRPAGDVVVLEPRSTNPKHKPIIVEREFRIQGIVVATIRPHDGGDEL